MLMHMRAVDGIMRSMDQETDLRATTTKWLREILTHKGINASALAKESDASQSSLSRFLNGDAGMLSADTLARIAAVSPVAIPRRIQDVLDRRPKSRQERPVNILGYDAESIPVLGAIPVQRDGEFSLNPMALNYFSRPSTMRASRKVIAFFAPDETMAPRWQAGEPVFVDMARPGATGEVVMIKLAADERTPNETETYLFRRYDGRRAGALHASRYSDDEQTSIPLPRVLEVRRVLTWSDMSD